MQFDLNNPEQYLAYRKAQVEAKARNEAVDTTEPKLFHKGKEVEQASFIEQYEEFDRNFKHTSADRQHDLIVNITERLDIQMRFEAASAKIEKEFTAKLENVNDRATAAMQAFVKHSKNFNAAKRDYVESAIKLDTAKNRHDQREVEYKNLVNKFGNLNDLSAKIDESSKALDKAEDSAYDARKSLVDHYKNQSNASAEAGIGKHLDSARQENNRNLQDARSKIETFSIDTEWKASNGETFRGTEQDTVVSTSWRDKLANAVEGLGAKGIADKIRGTDELQTKEIAMDKSFDERQKNLMAAAANAKDPDVVARFQGQQVFEKANRDLEKMKEIQLAGGDSHSLRQDMQKMTGLLNASAEKMARADVNLAQKGAHTELNDNRPVVTRGPADQVNVIQSRLSKMDEVQDFKQERTNSISQFNTVNAAANNLRTSAETGIKLADATAVAAEKVDDLKAVSDESKKEIRGINAERRDLNDAHHESMGNLIKNRDAAMDRIDRKTQQTETDMAIPAPTNPASKRAAERINKLDAQPPMQASERELNQVKATEASIQKVTESQKQTQKQSTGLSV